MPVYMRHKKYGKTSRRRDLTERLDDIEGLLEELLARSDPSPRDTTIKTVSPYFRKFSDRVLVGHQAKLNSDALQCYSSRTLVYLPENIDCSFMFPRAALEDSTPLLVYQTLNSHVRDDP